ncbi:MAG: bifunctional 4-hydroxy-2-oxoglutarate aldolase/2-dehydro-3-deoxy-phosphogluconate aldolase [Acidobacteria bacterium]|nr:bifunctional 4-hydroxy-2-oxoglutarate aldolase/2-dehydro-3-deoxy-phosphogluconate aldolase [Acidobacteriota bacterium]
MSGEDPGSDVRAAIDACGVIAILRGGYLERLPGIIGAIHAGGVRAVEISLNSPDALLQISRAVRHASGRLVVGAGTVLTCDEVKKVHDAGARFTVSPVVDPDVISTALRLGLTPIPGAYTPTEVRLAAGAGAAAVKLFPARTLGADFVRALLVPFPDVRLVPTGGVTLEDAHRFARAGAWAVGIGTPLLGDGTDAAGNLEQRARSFVSAMRPPA